MSKKILAFFLSICIAVTMLPITAFADGNLLCDISVSEVGSDVKVYLIPEGDKYILSIQGKGKMKDFGASDGNRPEWYGYAEYLIGIEIEENITNIGSYAFYDCKFNKVVLPSTINNIHENAFVDSKVSVVDLTKLNKTTTIGENAFYSENLKIIYLSDKELLDKLGRLDGATSVAITNGGMFPDNTEYKDDELCNPKKTDSSFEGWYVDNTKIESGSKIQGNKVYYAKWTSSGGSGGGSSDESQGKPSQGTGGDLSEGNSGSTGGSQDNANANSPGENGNEGTGGDTQTEPNGDNDTNTDDNDNSADLVPDNDNNTQGPDTDETKKTYDLSNIKFEDGEALYDGKAHTLKISGTLPEGVSVSYKYENEIVPVFPGKYKITAEFTGDAEQYNPIPSKTAELTIKKGEMKLTFGYETLKVQATDKPFTASLDGIKERAPVTYTSSDPAVADIDQDGQITPKANGVTTISASAAATTNYNAASTKFTLTVVGGSANSDNADDEDNKNDTDDDPQSDPKDDNSDDGEQPEADPKDEVLNTISYPNGTKVIVPKNPGKIMTASVKIPDTLDHAVVTIPAEEIDYGTVALNADNGEIIKMCVPDTDGLMVLLEQSMDLILFDNSKTFKDTTKHWGKDFIEFASAHDLFAGTSETEFSPNVAMTRGMMMTVLASFADIDTSGGAVWYERGMNWAKAMGISDGTYPMNPITREQLAVMLYHYVGDPEVSKELPKNFTDTKKISSYAVTAMRWAIENGVISGMGDNTLAPRGQATRAQVATMMKHVCEYMIEEQI